MNNKNILIILVLGILAIVAYMAYSSGPVVSAQGTSNLNVAPDQVSVYVYIESRNVSAQGAQEMNKQIEDSLVYALITSGFDKDELQFVNYNVYPDYDYSGNGQKLKGYVVSQQLVVKTNETKTVTLVVDAAINSKALVQGINFELSDSKQKEFKNKALEEASKDARNKAESIASGQGRGLGRLVSLENQEFSYNPGIYYAKADSAGLEANSDARVAALNLNPQSLQVTANIYAKYKLSLF
jgi:uncharacterized protein YggE